MLLGAATETKEGKREVPKGKSKEVQKQGQRGEATPTGGPEGGAEGRGHTHRRPSPHTSALAVGLYEIAHIRPFLTHSFIRANLSIQSTEVASPRGLD